jgi:ferrochelatase
MPFAPEPPQVSNPPPAGVLLANIGSPVEATPKAVRAFLREFLNDPRVIELPRLRWWLIRNLLILPFRPFRVARAYRKIWTQEGSPLAVTSRRIAADLEWALGQRIDRPIPVFCGMRYGKPSLAAALGVLRQRGCQKILILPLFPQYSATTSASVFDQVFRELTRWRRVPEIRTVASYHDFPLYIQSLASSIHQAWTETGQPKQLLMSFHGLPERYVAAGDPYETHCHNTAALLTRALDFDPENITTAFQSRFGREPWIGLDTAVQFKNWGRQGLRGLDVICPGFATDCLETLEEIDVRGRKIFTKNGGKRFRYIPALNFRPDHIDALAQIATENLTGWIV